MYFPKKPERILKTLDKETEPRQNDIYSAFLLDSSTTICHS